MLSQISPKRQPSWLQHHIKRAKKITGTIVKNIVKLVRPCFIFTGLVNIMIFTDRGAAHLFLWARLHHRFDLISTQSLGTKGTKLWGLAQWIWTASNVIQTAVVSKHAEWAMPPCVGFIGPHEKSNAQIIRYITRYHEIFVIRLFKQ